MYSFEKRLDRITTTDTIRVYKLVEIFQFSLIFFVLIVFTSYLLNKFYFDTKHHSNKDNKPTPWKVFKKFVKVYLEVFVVIVIFFYIRKIGLLFPSIPHLYNPKFREHTTLEYSVHIALIVVFIELIPKFKHNVEELMEMLLEL